MLGDHHLAHIIAFKVPSSRDLGSPESHCPTSSHRGVCTELMMSFAGPGCQSSIMRETADEGLGPAQGETRLFVVMPWMRRNDLSTPVLDPTPWMLYAQMRIHSNTCVHRVPVDENAHPWRVHSRPLRVPTAGPMGSWRARVPLPPCPLQSRVARLCSPERTRQIYHTTLLGERA